MWIHAITLLPPHQRIAHGSSGTWSCSISFLTSMATVCHNDWAIREISAFLSRIDRLITKGVVRLSFWWKKTCCSRPQTTNSSLMCQSQNPLISQVRSYGHIMIETFEMAILYSSQTTRSPKLLRWKPSVSMQMASVWSSGPRHLDFK